MTESIGPAPNVTRRRVIAGATVLGLGGVVAALHQAPKNGVPPTQMPPNQSPTPSSRPTKQRRDYTTRRAFDDAEAIYRQNQTEHPGASVNPGGGLAWGESRLLQSYLTMYQATGEVSYLDKLVDASQPVLAARDDHRGRVDYRGLSLPGWAAANPYTVSQLDLADETGTPTLRLVVAATEQRVLVDVRPGPASLFDLSIRGSSGVSETAKGVSLDPAHPRYVVLVLRQQYPGPASVTATDLRRDPSGGGFLARATGISMAPERYVFAVHTGMICSPLAQFAALLVRVPDLRRRFGAAAGELQDAAENAIHVHDADWRRLSDKAGIYTFATGSPVRADGTYLPHNQYLAVARCLAHLFVATQDPGYRERATLMFNLFRADVSEGESPTWPYYWSGSQPYRGFGTPEIRSVHSPHMAPQQYSEDSGHGALDIGAVVAGIDTGFNVPVSLMPRLAATFLGRVVRRGSNGRWVTAKRFGSSEVLPPNDLAGIRWIELAKWDRRVYTVVSALFDQLQPAPREEQVLSSMAQMVALR